MAHALRTVVTRLKTEDITDPVIRCALLNRDEQNDPEEPASPLSYPLLTKHHLRLAREGREIQER